MPPRRQSCQSSAVTLGTITGVNITAPSNGVIEAKTQDGLARAQLNAGQFNSDPAAGFGFNGKAGVGLIFDDTTFAGFPLIGFKMSGGGVLYFDVESTGTSIFPSAGALELNDAEFANGLNIGPTRAILRQGYLELGFVAGNPQATLRTGNGSPEGSIGGNVGSLFFRLDGAVDSTIYVKELASIGGDATKGWTAIRTYKPREQCLAQDVSLDLTATTKQAIYTTPTGFRLLGTRVVFHDPSGEIDPDNDVVLSLGPTALANYFAASVNLKGMGVAQYLNVSPDAAFCAVGAAADVFGAKMTTPALAACTVLADLFGILVPVSA